MKIEDLISTARSKKAALLEQRASHTDHLAALRAQESAGHPVDPAEVVKVRTAKAECDAQIGKLEDQIRELGREKTADDEMTRAQAIITPTNVRAPGGNRSEHVGATDPGLRSIEAAHDRGAISARAAERIEQMCRTGTESERTMASEWAASTGSDAYLRAFGKLLRNSAQGHLEFSGDELAAFQRVQAWRGQMSERAALTTGGYVLPMSVDPVVMLTNAGAISGIADSAKMETVSVGNSWRGMTSAGATHEWKVEAAEVTDGSPTIAEVEVPLFSSSVFAQWSYELERAAQGDLEGQLADVVKDAVSVAWAAAFATGDGATAPQGLITGLAGTASEINGQGSEALALTDPYDLQAALPARFSRDARWLSHIATANAYRRFETTNGSHEFPELRAAEPMLLGKRWYEESSMDSSINAAATANNYMLVYGDIARAYVIATGIGSVVETLPAYGTNGRPIAGRGLLVWSRVGAEVVNVNAARLLDIPTTA